jgi:nucleoside-triphosphatase THEP1
LNGNNSDENQSEEDSMSMKKKAKIGKYAYDVELLEKEVYNIIQNIL